MMGTRFRLRQRSSEQALDDFMRAAVKMLRRILGEVDTERCAGVLMPGGVVEAGVICHYAVHVEQTAAMRRERGLGRVNMRSF